MLLIILCIVLLLLIIKYNRYEGFQEIQTVFEKDPKSNFLSPTTRSEKTTFPHTSII